MDAPSMPLGVLEILREAFKIPSRNGKLFLFIAVAFLIPIYLLDLAKPFAREPYAKDILAKSNMISNTTLQNDEQRENEKLSMEILKDAGFIILGSAVFMLVSSIISFFARIATIYGSAATYTRKHLTDMELAARIRCMWKRPVITWFDILLFNFGFFVLLFGLSVTVAVTWTASIPLAVVALVLDILAILYYFYFTVVWELSIVVSVLEPDNYGIPAVGKASELIKGRKRKGCILFALIMPVGFVIWGLLSLVSLYAPQNQATQLGIGLVSQIVSCSAAMFMAMASTLFYFDCKKNHGEKVEIEGGSGYSLIPFVTNNV